MVTVAVAGMHIAKPLMLPKTHFCHSNATSQRSLLRGILS
jgi:hypothetical protein